MSFLLIFRYHAPVVEIGFVEHSVIDRRAEKIVLIESRYTKSTHRNGWWSLLKLLARFSVALIHSRQTYLSSARRDYL